MIEREEPRTSWRILFLAGEVNSQDSSSSVERGGFQSPFSVLLAFEWTHIVLAWGDGETEERVAQL